MNMPEKNCEKMKIRYQPQKRASGGCPVQPLWDNFGGRTRHGELFTQSVRADHLTLPADPARQCEPDHSRSGTIRHTSACGARLARVYCWPAPFASELLCAPEAACPGSVILMRMIFTGSFGRSLASRGMRAIFFTMSMS